MNKIEEKRLLKLADKLPEVPRKKFNMRGWFTSLIKPGKGKSDPKRLLKGPYAAECGTAACALGQSVLLFPKHLEFFRTFTVRGEYKMSIRAIRDNGCVGFFAAESVFGISYDDALCIFMPRNGNMTPKQVARTIRRGVKKIRKRQKLGKANA